MRLTPCQGGLKGVEGIEEKVAAGFGVRFQPTCLVLVLYLVGRWRNTTVSARIWDSQARRFWCCAQVAVSARLNESTERE